MTLLLWSPDLELGIAQIDCQHRKLVDLLNALDSGVKKSYSFHILGSILTDLVRYTVCHFTFEERRMETHALPMLAEHQESTTSSPSRCWPSRSASTRAAPTSAPRR